MDNKYHAKDKIVLNITLIALLVIVAFVLFFGNYRLQSTTIQKEVTLDIASVLKQKLDVSSKGK